jgi:hypothetical protein
MESNAREPALVNKKLSQPMAYIHSATLVTRSGGYCNRAAQTGVFDRDIRISNRPFIDVCRSFAFETGLKSRNVEKRINAV